MTQVIILDPPAAPTVKNSVSLLVCSTITGLIDEKGRFPGAIKFAGEGMKPNALVVFGIEKSFISLFIMSPSSGTKRREPNPVFIVLVNDIVNPEASVATV
jgi:hypothetical protein